MRRVIRAFDHWLSRRLGIFTFSQADDCILRLAYGLAPDNIETADFQVEKGSPVVFLHLWNEHLPPYTGLDDSLVWAALATRQLRSSLGLAARYLLGDPRFNGVRAVMGVTALFSPPRHPGDPHPMEHFGFTVLPYHSPLGKFGEFWENFYSWMVLYAYSPASFHDSHLFSLRRTVICIEAGEFMRRYGA